VRDGRDVGAVAGTLIVEVIVSVTVTTSSVGVAEVVFPAALRTVIAGSADVVVLAVVEIAKVGATVSRTVTTGSTVVVILTITTVAVASESSAETASAVAVGVATSRTVIEISPPFTEVSFVRDGKYQARHL
jgi:hypothetical protein